MKQDAIRDLIQRLLTASQREGTFTESVALEIERQWRHEYHGAEIHVSYRPLADRLAQRLAPVEDYLAGKPVDEITRHHGISRATLYRYLKK